MAAPEMADRIATLMIAADAMTTATEMMIDARFLASRIRTKGATLTEVAKAVTSIAFRSTTATTTGSTRGERTHAVTATTSRTGTVITARRVAVMTHDTVLARRTEIAIARVSAPAMKMAMTMRATIAVAAALVSRGRFDLMSAVREDENVVGMTGFEPATP